jgi:GNAT superfamily N-acetyltransferase
MRSVDPLLPEAGPLPRGVDGDTTLSVPGAAGIARRRRVDPNSIDAMWGELDQRWLSAQAVDPEAMAALLSRWREHLAGDPAGVDSSAIVVWPSRDVAMVPVFLAHGLSPFMVIAVRLAGRATPAESTGVRVRRALPADLNAVLALRMEEVRYGAPLSPLLERPDFSAVVKDRYAAALSAHEPTIWLADVDGEAVGLISVTVGEEAAWIAPMVATAPVAYLDCAAVLPAHRGARVASALIAHVHQAMDTMGISATLLHYNTLNPISGPFWHRSGYRPLRTRWQISPAR